MTRRYGAPSSDSSCLLTEQIHDLHRPEEEGGGQHGGDAHAQIGGHADGAADALQILFAPVLADEDAHAGLDAEHDGDQQEHRHVGGGDGGHLVVAQLADHEGVDETEREGDKILQGDGGGEPRQIAVKAVVALECFQHSGVPLTAWGSGRPDGPSARHTGRPRPMWCCRGRRRCG